MNLNAAVLISALSGTWLQYRRTYTVSVREFGTFTADLEALAVWLKQCGVTTVAMESTGVY